MARPRTLLCLIGAAALLAGCGGDESKAPAAPTAPRLSVDRYATKVDDVQELYLKELAGEVGFDPAQPTSQAERARKTSQAANRLARRVRRLRPPAKLEAAHRGYTDAVGDVGDANAALADAGLALLGQRAQAVADANETARRARVALDRRVKQLR